jgi:phosphate transport system protein
MRARYLKQLQLIHDDLLQMGNRVEYALAAAMDALMNWDISRAQQVIAADPEIDLARTTIEEAVLEVLAIQQPVLATDLRTLTATIAIAGELERAGDYAKGIAKRVGRCLETPAIIDPPTKLHQMSLLAQAMLQASLDAFVRRDVDLARSLAGEDERVDALEDQVIDELMSVARQDSSKLDCAIQLLDITHTLERVADRTTNIAERVIFIATSQTEQLNT